MMSLPSCGVGTVKILVKTPLRTCLRPITRNRFAGKFESRARRPTTHHSTANMRHSYPGLASSRQSPDFQFLPRKADEANINPPSSFPDSLRGLFVRPAFDPTFDDDFRPSMRRELISNRVPGASTFFDDDDSQKDETEAMSKLQRTDSKTTMNKSIYKRVLAPSSDPNSLRPEPGAEERNSDSAGRSVFQGGHPPKLSSDMDLESMLSLLSGEQRRVLPQIPNEMQIEVYPFALGSTENLVVSAPTGGGKTSVMDAAILNEIFEAQRRGANKSLIYYVAPARALCKLQGQGFANRFARMGNLRITLRTGDVLEETGYLRPKNGGRITSEMILSEHGKEDVCELVLITPEKFEAATRRIRGDCDFGIKLILIDEVHHIGERERGATLETAITRVLMSKGLPPRVIAVSATIPNAKDVAEWLKARCFVFYERPVPLEVHVIGYPFSGNDFLFERELDHHVPGVLRTYGKDRPTIVFVSSRKGAKSLAERLVQIGVRSKAPTSTLQMIASRISDAALSVAVQRGVAWHSAGLTIQDRSVVQDAFLSGKLSVIVSTSTLSMGVDLPAYCVIIKSTRAYRGPSLGFQDIERATLVQMIGRAGRAGYDKEGVAVVMTQSGNEDMYQDLINGLRPVQSAMLQNLDEAREAMNTEICRGVVVDHATCREWWSRTFAATLDKNPNIAIEILSSLVELGCTELGQTEPRKVQATVSGRIASSHHLHLATLATFRDAAVELEFRGLRATLELLSRAQEFEFLEPRRDQKRWLNNIRHVKGRFRSLQNSKVTDAAGKAFELMQAALGGHHEGIDLQMRQESAFCQETAPRLARALLKMLVSEGNPSAVSCAFLLRSLELGLWESEELKQLDGVGAKTKDTLEKEEHVRTLEDVLNKNLAGAVIPKRTLTHARKLWSERRVPFCSVDERGTFTAQLKRGESRTIAATRRSSAESDNSSQYWLAATCDSPTLHGKGLLGWNEGLTSLNLARAAIEGREMTVTVWALHRRALGMDSRVDTVFARNGSIKRQSRTRLSREVWSEDSMPKPIKRGPTTKDSPAPRIARVQGLATREFVAPGRAPAVPVKPAVAVTQHSQAQSLLPAKPPQLAKTAPTSFANATREEPRSWFVAAAETKRRRREEPASMSVQPVRAQAMSNTYREDSGPFLSAKSVEKKAIAFAGTEAKFEDVFLA